MTEQLTDLQKKSDGFEAELMQERMAHVSTRDELETLRQQLDTVREEMNNEREGQNSRLAAVQQSMEAQIAIKEEVSSRICGAANSGSMHYHSYLLLLNFYKM